MKRFLYGNVDGSNEEDHHVLRTSEQNINASARNTDIDNSRIPTNTPSYLRSPTMKYGDKNNMGDLSPFGGMRRTYMQRTFGPMQQGSVRGSIFALCAVAIGAGVLSLPYVLRINGCILGTALIIIGAISGYYSMEMILIRSIESKSKNFSELAQKAGGKGLTILL